MDDVFEALYGNLVTEYPEEITIVPPGFDCTFAVVCRLSQDGNRFRWLFQSRVASA